MQPIKDIRQKIPSNKFYPPRLDTNGYLFRSRLITSKLGEESLARKIIVIEAQAGQGKSMLAAQFLNHFNLRFAWYQVGTEDADPVLLLSALLTTFCHKLPGFKSPQLSQIMYRGEIGPLDLKRCINILLTDLDKFLADDFYLVFDDIHLIETASLAIALLDHILDTAPPRLHFLLTSRRPPVMASKTLRYSGDILYLDNDDLSLSLAEVEQLFSQVLKITVSREKVEELHRFTSGWIMGILLAAHPIAGKKKQRSILPDKLSPPQLLEYFRDEIFIHIPKQLQLPLLKICFLVEIPVELAVRITGRDNIGKQLTKMMEDNFFVYPLDDEHQIFRFHHLFQEFLQYRANTQLSAAEIDHASEIAAEFHLHNGAVEKALACYAARRHYPQMEDLLKKEGLQLLAENRTFTLVTLLTAIPEQRLLEHGWLTLFCGLVFADYHPQKTLPMLEAARHRFIILNEEIGELLALAQTIYFHFVVSGLYHTGALLLPRTEELLLRHQDALPMNARIMVARNLAAGYCFFNSRMDKARRYAQMARDLAIRHDSPNYVASSRFICGYIESLTGNQDAGLQEIELAYPLLHDPLVGMSNKLTLRVLQLNFLTKYGDAVNFVNQKNQLRQSIDTQIVQQTVAAPYLYVWGCAALVTLGKLDRAREMLQQGTVICDVAKTSHMSSQLLQWEGYIDALQGNRDNALKNIQKAGTLRNESGGPFYETFYEIIAGATYGRIGMMEQAQVLLSSALEKAQTIPSNYLAAAALLHRSWLNLQKKNKASAKKDLSTALKILNKNRYLYVWSWEPLFMEELLTYAVHNGIESNFAGQLARQRLKLALQKKNGPVPLLSISMLGPFTISSAGKIILKTEDFTPAQRVLLSLLLTSPGQQMDQENIQVELWPDSSPEKARAKFDTLLVRLRKVMSARLDVPVKHYLVMRKGILSLKNCCIDAVEFGKLASLGLKHAHTERYWQAGNAFYRALTLWTGPLEADSFMGNRTAEYYDQLIILLSKMTNTWTVYLAESDCVTEAIEILIKVLHYDPMNDRLITLLYDLYLKAGNHLKAKEILLDYRRALREIDYAQEQIDDLLFQVVSRTG